MTENKPKIRRNGDIKQDLMQKMSKLADMQIQSRYNGPAKTGGLKNSENVQKTGLSIFEILRRCKIHCWADLVQ